MYTYSFLRRKLMEPGLLEEMNIVVTGGTQGLGEAVARTAARYGAAGIVICGRNEKNGCRVEEEIRATGTACTYIPADLQREEECRNVIARGIDAYGTIHGLVNAAGVTDRGTIEDTPIERWDFIMNVNARAPFILMQEVIRHMKSSEIGGSIVNMVSDNAHGGQPYLSAYAASKGALATLTKNVAHAVRFDRIRVNAVLLGWMYTPHEHLVQVQEGRPEDWLEKVEREKPFGRLLRPDDIAELAAFLLSDRAMMMTGSLIDYDQKVIGGLD
jgi:NAD(P)-dependent dehydrogenase (short-subunit alcohol dehydrogenase family)